MNPSTAHARVLVDELLRCGVRDVVLCPGSRSAPLAYAVLAAERAGSLRLHVRVDERTAGFLALGLAKVSRRPAAVITTSGTAVANLHPAVLEADHGAVPLLLLTADRPSELRGTGANQTTRQPGLFGRAVRWEVDQPAAERGADGSAEQAAWRSDACRAWVAATGGLGGRPGPAHLNVAFRDPLPPPEPAGRAGGVRSALPPALAGRPDGRPWTAPAPTDAAGLDPRVRTLLVLGDLPDPAQADEALRLAMRNGWPVIAEPFGAGDRRGVVPHGPLLLAARDWVDRHLPERILVVGRITLSRDLGRLLRSPGVRVELVTTGPDWPDPSHVAQTVHPWAALRRAMSSAGAGPGRGTGTTDVRWAAAWVQAGMDVSRAARRVVAASWPSGPAIADTVLESLATGDTLVVGSSNAARDVDLAASWRPDHGTTRPTVVANRGLAGIDGTVSTALGIALAARASEPDRGAPGGGPGCTVALLGDLTFLHDASGLAFGPDEPRPDLTLVVVNDDGGGIFATLEYGAPARSADFERVFGTPTGTDLAALCRAHGIPHEVAGGAPDLAAALAGTGGGVRVVEVRVDRSRHRDLREQLAAAAAAAVR